MYFSCFAKKSTKRRRLKEALSCLLISALRAGLCPVALRNAPAGAAASKAALLENPSGAHLRRLWSTLTSILFKQKMFRFFYLKSKIQENRQGGRRGTTRLSCDAESGKSCPIRCSRGTGDARRVGYIGEGGSGAGATSISASPMPLSLVTFLAGQESNITAPPISKMYIF